MIRHATPADGASCAEIYLPSVREGVASLEDVPPDADEMTTRIHTISQTHPWLVDERDGELAGYAYASRHHNRSAYRWATDVTVYVSERHKRRGVARGLYERLFELVRAQGFTVACAGITLPNAASVGLHEALGFEPVGVYRKVAWKLGEWRDVGWWQLELLPMGAERPAEPRGPQR
jgi:phosphinothricin acetyltransferase